MTLPALPSRYRLPAAVAGGVLLVGVAYLAARPAQAPAPAAPVAAAEAPPPPSGDNVDPAVHSRLMTLKARVEAAPDSAAAHLALARFLQSAHRQREAAEAFEAALALDASDRQAWLDLTNAYGADGRWAEAARAADRMADRFAGDGAALYNAGAALANAGDTDAARARFEAAASAADAEMAAQARSALTQLASMPAGTPAAAPGATASGAAPTLSADAAAGPLPSGHPPLPAGHPPLPSGGATPGGATQRVVDGGVAANPEAVRALLSRQAPLAARPRSGAAPR